MSKHPGKPAYRRMSAEDAAAMREAAQDGMTIREASDHLGIRYGTLWKWAKTHGVTFADGRITTPMTWRGKAYPSCKAVAEASGRTVSAIMKQLSRHGHLDRLAADLPIRGGRKIGRWRSVAHLAREAGVDAHRLRRQVREGDQEAIVITMMRADRGAKGTHSSAGGLS